jgi:GMP synthase (glutamine-hydrolysing)
MTKQIAIIDPFVKSPALHCFNYLVDSTGLRATYHLPSLLGMSSLLNVERTTQAFIVLGSASHVHEDLPWHRPLADFLLKQLHLHKPVLGCCFGHQLICHAFGAKVEFYDPSENKLSGLRTMTITKDAWNFKKGESFTVAVTHRQVVRDLPPELSEMGVGLANDMVIHNHLPFLGTQGHPEASLEFCHSDIQNLTPDEVKDLQLGGKQLIQRFFKHFQLI